MSLTKMRVKLVLTQNKHKMHDDAEIDVECNEFKNIQHKTLTVFRASETQQQNINVLGAGKNVVIL